MQCYSELTAPSAVTHSISLSLTAPHSNNLVVARASLLQVFRTKNALAENDLAAESALSRKTSGQVDSRAIYEDDGFSFLGGGEAKPDRLVSTRLVLVAEFALCGTITGLARIRNPKKSAGAADALLLAFKDAKLSLVEWEADTHTLATVSIHYYEQEDLQGPPWAAPLSEYHNFLSSDPGSRCAALKFGARSLAILPFKQADEDMGMGDWDEALDGPRPAKDLSSEAPPHGTGQSGDTPYSPSFVLRLSNLDASLLHPVHLAFLHEYREPTFGILSSTQYRSCSLGRKDHLSYMVFTLDLQQKASTTILSVTGLPQDLFRVVSLPAPIGGALLLGSNELIHVNQAGKTNGVAVNPLAKQCTSFGLSDQSGLNLRLEDCAVEVLSPEIGEFLLVVSDGRLALLTFKVDGRTVSGLEVKMISPEAGGLVVPGRVASLTRIGRGHIFAGSEDGDSLLIGWTHKQSPSLRKKSRVSEADGDVDIEGEDDGLGDDDDDDDLYASDTAQPTMASIAHTTGKAGDMTFRVHDRLLSIAPIRAMTYGKPALQPGSETEKKAAGVSSDLQLACAVGRDGSSALAVINREIQPKVIGRFDFPEAKGFWTMRARKPWSKQVQADRDAAAAGPDFDVMAQYDKYMIVAKIDLDGYETSDVYALTAAGFESLAGTEFEPAAGFTVEAGTMGENSRIVQVLKAEVRCYDGGKNRPSLDPALCVCPT